MPQPQGTYDEKILHQVVRYRTLKDSGKHFWSNSAVAKSLKKSLLKTEELAPLNRLKGASDAAEDC